MSNKSYLVISDVNRIYPSYQNADFDTSKSTVLESAGCIPLLWFALFDDGDMVSHTFQTDAGDVTAIAPIVRTKIALERLLSKKRFFSMLFESNGGLAHHVDMLYGYLSGFEGEYITILYDEIEGLMNIELEDGEFQLLLNQALLGVRLEDVASKPALIELSTVMSERQFITFNDAKGQNIEQEEMWNYFRIMGDRYVVAIPWQ